MTTTEDRTNWANSRIAVSTDTRVRLKSIAFGADMTQGEAVAMILDLCQMPNEGAVELGRRLRREWERKAAGQ